MCVLYVVYMCVCQVGTRQVCVLEFDARWLEEEEEEEEEGKKKEEEEEESE